MDHWNSAFNSEYLGHCVIVMRKHFVQGIPYTGHEIQFCVTERCGALLSKSCFEFGRCHVQF